MNKPILVAVVVALCVAVPLLRPHREVNAPAEKNAKGVSAAAVLNGEVVFPLPQPPELAPDKVALGEKLFFDKRLSADDSIACASCHDLARGGSDHVRVSRGVGGKPGTVNAPSVFNAALNFVQFWDGRAATLEEQVPGPVHNPLEMASSWGEVVPKLQKDAAYREAFAHLYLQGITDETVVDAIVTYERTLITPNSRFDRYLQGDKLAINAAEEAGYHRFLDFGCASCHQGALLGGNMYQRFGVMGDVFAGKTQTLSDLGRFNVTGREEDRYVFKVPSLRNVALTAPYFHDGSAATLEEAVSIMARYQLGRELSGQDIASISAFLRTLTGEWRGKMLE